MSYQLIDIANITTLESNPRKDFNQVALAELSASIDAHGIIQPLVVRPNPSLPEFYELVAGERRWRCATKLGLIDVPCMVRHLSDLEVAEIQLVENIDRHGLSPLEESYGVCRLVELGVDPHHLAERLGRADDWVQLRLDLPMLPDLAKDAIENGVIGLGGARKILQVEESEREEAVQRLMELDTVLTERTISEVLHNRYHEPRRRREAWRNLFDAMSKRFSGRAVASQGAYICGEETALIASIEGRRAEVDVRPPFPVTEGLYKKPTVVNNVETLAAATGILINGPEKFSAIGNKKSAGTKLVCLDSFFNNPGVYEIDMGTPMKKIFNEIGGGYKEPVKAFQVGGPLGGVVPLSEIDNLNLDFQEFTAKGFMLGHASVVSIPKDFSMSEYIHHLFEFSAEESCGKCFPGRLGSYRGKEMFDQAKKGTAKIPLKLLNELLITMQKGCLCALCGAIPTPIMNILKYFGDEMKNDMMKDN